MQDKLLESAVESVSGKTGVEVSKFLFGKKNVNEFLIAKKIKLAINQTRNVLYKLAEAGLIAFTRKKDKRKGWYTYFWTFSELKAWELVQKIIMQRNANLQKQLEHRVKERYYHCENCNIEVSEEAALLHNFTCQECGVTYELSEKDKIVTELKNKIVKLHGDLSAVAGNIKVLREKQTAKNIKNDKIKQTKKKNERRAVREKMKKIEKRIQKKAQKKNDKK